MMDLINVSGFTIDVVGKVMIAYTAIAVHTRFWKEHRVDERVFEAMKKERWIGIIGVIFIIAGYLMQLPGKL